MNYTVTVQTHPPPQAALTVYLTLSDDEGCGHQVPRPQERVLRHIVALIVEFAPVVQILDLLVPQIGREGLGDPFCSVAVDRSVCSKGSCRGACVSCFCAADGFPLVDVPKDQPLAVRIP